MNLVLSMLSSTAIAALFDDKFHLCGVVDWTRSEGSELADNIQTQLEKLFKLGSVSSINLTKLYGMEGPGSFTGLRVSAAFLKGYSTGLNIPLFGIPTFRLYGESVAISLRAQKASKLSLDECIVQKYKFLEILSDKETRTVDIPTTKKILGLKDNPIWPNVKDIERGLRQSQDKKSFSINYGYDPAYVMS
jgi:tRNA A37 threonylcarbamoyladenosine modification protein TsaB